MGQLSLPCSKARQVLSAEPRTVLTDPAVDVVGFPDLALSKIRYGPGEAGAAGDLVGALPADPTKKYANLVGANEAEAICGHTLTLVIGQASS
jgi:hypothetical protein